MPLILQTFSLMNYIQYFYYLVIVLSGYSRPLYCEPGIILLIIDAGDLYHDTNVIYVKH